MSDITKTIAELKELEAKATPGPWGWGVFLSENILADPDKELLGSGMSDEDTALIAAMRNALPELLEQIAYLDQEAGDYHDEWQAAERSLKEWQELWNDLLALAGIELEPGDEATAKDVYDQIALKFSEERDAALARADKAEARLELVAKHQAEHQDAEVDLYGRLESAWEHAEQMQAERDVLVGILAANDCPYLVFESADDLPWCECTDTEESGFECTVNCQEDCWLKYAAQRANAKRGEVAE